MALRERTNLGYAQLSRKLKEAGRAIPELGLRRIEDGDRRVDVDDLAALAETAVNELLWTDAKGEPVKPPASKDPWLSGAVERAHKG